eukprot:CAMPEP_0173218038 /NCGR_PEP_ID=MMETSP1142-20121109/828_1 /TAXON_ID=483371 /ORGANISM="non described non described, Strain CCMP2298" /LENGTH=509 /DNA_ID=CAMNT_0014145683 /DNA_START=217 /DNA_END=1746 /DNA_ORIENTATION=-
MHPLYLTHCVSTSPTLTPYHAQLVAELGNLYPDISLRLGFVGYRDHCNGRLHIVQLPFTHSVADFQTSYVSAQQPIRAGGGNFADVLGGLQAAAAMQWASTTRILYHLGDQPCHGKEFNKSSNPGVPTGLSALTQLKALSGQDVLYFFGQITSCTDKMIARFNELMQTQFVDQTPLTASNMMRVITSSVTTSLSTTLSSSSRTDGHTSSCKMFKIDSVMPDWAGVKIERAVRFSVIQPSSMDALVDEADDSVVESYPHPEAVQLLVASRPFAQGAVRLAYHALELPTATGSGAGAGIKGGQSRVLKESKSAGKAHQKLERYRSYLSPQRAAAYLAEQFETAKPQGCASIRFVDTSLLQFLGRPDKPYMIMEEEIDGVWEKYNGNSGYCSPQPTSQGTDHSAVQCFSHWTHHITGGRMMVVDCQGSWTGGGAGTSGTVNTGFSSPTPDCFLLTDPAVNCTSLLRFGSTNLGHRGFDRFFRTHRCNQHCAALGLLPPPPPQAQAQAQPQYP